MAIRLPLNKNYDDSKPYRDRVEGDRWPSAWQYDLAKDGPLLDPVGPHRDVCRSCTCHPTEWVEHGGKS